MARQLLGVMTVGCLALGMGARLKRAASNHSSGLAARWEQVQQQGPEGRIPAASTWCDGRLFIFGGETDAKDATNPWVVNRYLNDLWMFTPSSGARGQWSRLSADGDKAAPEARVGSSMVCSAGILTIFGGATRRGDQFPLLEDIWSFDVSRRRWREVQAAGGPGPLTRHTATLTDKDQDSMVVFGGEFYQKFDKVWIYSLGQNKWKLGRPPFNPRPRSGHIAVAIPETATLRVWGGVEDTNVWQYDLLADAWSWAGSGQSFKSGRAGVFFNGELWSFGGWEMQGNIPVYSNELSVQEDGYFDSVSTAGRALPEGRCFPTMAAMSGAIWVFGGYRRPADVERLPDLWRLTPA